MFGGRIVFGGQAIFERIFYVCAMWYWFSLTSDVGPTVFRKRIIGGFAVT